MKYVSLVVLFYCIDSDLVGLEMMLDNGEDYLSLELDKHKKRLKEITTALEMQHQLLRLIVQVTFLIFCYYTNIMCNFLRKWKLKLKLMTWTKEFHQMI